MTQRIAIAILLTVWAMLIAGGLVAYFTTRSVLLRNLDESLVARALSRAAQVNQASAIIGGRYVIKNELKQTIASDAGYDAKYEPQLTSAQFSEADGVRYRTVTVRYFAVTPGDIGQDPKPFTETTSESAESFNALLRRLAWALGSFGIAGGLVSAFVALRVSRAALRPLANTAAQIGAIDESRLDRRIDAAALPPELAAMADRLNEMLARLQTAFTMRTRFLADASHELRTPVAALVTTLDVILRNPRTADAYRTALEDCRGDARQLRQLVERLMEQVRSQNLSQDEPPEPIDVAALLSNCADIVAPLAEQKGINMVRRFNAPLLLTVTAGRLRSVVMNLLSNAIEYNRPNGTVELACSPNGSGLNLIVRDTGIGVSPEHLPHLFEPFYRVDKSRSQDSGHLGLGLSLVQAHVHAMAGTCDAESAVGIGTTFRVHLPQFQSGETIARPQRSSKQQVR
jgi:signal transduction histidine kinase